MDNTTNTTQGAQSAQQNTAEVQPQQTNANPAGTGGKTFTQEEVNRIVADRLARERSKAAPKQTPDPLAEREKDLAAREHAMQCRELVAGNKHYPAQLLDVLDTSNFDAFKKQADKLLAAFPNIAGDAPRIVFTRPGNPAAISSSDAIGEAFRHH